MSDHQRTINDGKQLPVAPMESSSAQVARENFQQGPEELDWVGLYPRRMDASRKEIRLVSFESPFFEEIRMHMHCVSLEDANYFEYEALSYTCDGPLIATPRNCRDKENWLLQVALPVSETLKDGGCHEGGHHTASSDRVGGVSSTPNPNTIPKARTIQVNNHTLEIKENLYLALEQLRKRPGTGDLWIDAICISQRDLRERSEQVLLVGEIYKNAKEVLIWLGEETGSTGTDRAIDLLDHLVSSCNKFVENRCQEDMEIAQSVDTLINESDAFDSGQVLTMDRAMSMFQIITRLQTEWIDSTDFFSFRVRSDREVWNVVAGLFERSWFWRVWTIQEKMLAKFATVLVGAKSISWGRLQQAILIIVQHDARPGKQKVMPNGEYRHAFDACLTTQVAESPQNLLHLVRTSNKRQCSDARDRVYAVLSALDQNDPGFRYFYNKVDYKYTSVQALYREFSRFYLEDQKDLRVLQSCDNNAYRIKALPTWVADWSHQITVNFLAYDEYCAAGSSEVVADYDGTTEVLTLLGVIIDRIQLLAPLAYGSIEQVFSSPDQSKFASEVFETFAKVYTVASGCQTHPERLEGRWSDIATKLDWHARYTTGETCAEAYWRTLLTDRSPHVQLHIKDRLAKTASISSAIGGCIDPKSLPENFQPEEPNLAKRLKDFVRPYAGKIWRETCGKRFFLTEKGLMGLGPETAREGDLAVIFFGGNVPFLLRKQEVGTSLIGECYVHGRMDGEIIQTVNAGECEVVNFNIV